MGRPAHFEAGHLPHDARSTGGACVSTDGGGKIGRPWPPTGPRFRECGRCCSSSPRPWWSPARRAARSCSRTGGGGGGGGGRDAIGEPRGGGEGEACTRRRGRGPARRRGAVRSGCPAAYLRGVAASAVHDVRRAD